MQNIEKLSWLAGIIDGEGYLTTNKRQGIIAKKLNNGQGSLSFVTRVGVGSTDCTIIKKISEILYEMNVKFYFTLHNPSKKFINAKKYISINVEGYRSVKKLLKSIIDYMHSNKKEEAKAMLIYIDYRLNILNNRKEFNSLTAQEKINKFNEIDVEFVKNLKALKNSLISPSTTKRVASKPLEWFG